jgi:hypothetical protein
MNGRAKRNPPIMQKTMPCAEYLHTEHKGPFAGHPPTDAHVQVPGCSVYEYNSGKRQITAGRIYFDVGTLLKQIAAA